MSKFTRRSKKNKKNKTIKRGGASEEGGIVPVASSAENEERKGVLDIVGDKITSLASSALTTAEDTALKIAGLERINKSINSGPLPRSRAARRQQGICQSVYAAPQHSYGSLRRIYRCQL